MYWPCDVQQYCTRRDVGGRAPNPFIIFALLLQLPPFRGSESHMQVLLPLPYYGARLLLNTFKQLSMLYEYVLFLRTSAIVYLMVRSLVVYDEYTMF